MELDQLILDLKNYLSHPLSRFQVDEIRKQLSPTGRDILEQEFSNDYRQSAVMILLYPKKGQIYFVLIERKSYKGVHSGQISLPGGGYESSDLDLIETALRETKEEIGVSIPRNQVLGQLTVLPVPVSGYIVDPVLGYSTQELDFEKQTSEVERIIEVELEELVNAPIEIGQFDTSYGFKIKAPFFQLAHNQVWGATAMILAEFKAVLKGF